MKVKENDRKNTGELLKLLGVVSASRWGVCITAGAKVGRLKHVDHGLKMTGESCPILLE